MNILITGASKGIGFELVQKFASDKTNNVIALARDLDQLKSLQTLCEKQFNNVIHIYSIDFLSSTLEDQLSILMSELDCHFDVVVNNAGHLINKAFAEMKQKEIFDIYQINVFAPMLLIKSLIPFLDKDKASHVLNIGSMGGFQGSVKFPGLSIYSSSKSALGNLTECLAEEYKAENVFFNCLALGSVQTEMLNTAFPGFEAQVSAKEMASYVYGFAIQRPLYVNGKVIPVSNTTP
tara:strand:- start:3 stop:710 length:708 start_codon:yes stop_codon:yes gene_type:complete